MAEAGVPDRTGITSEQPKCINETDVDRYTRLLAAADMETRTSKATIYKGWGEVAQRCLGDVTVAINAQTLGVLTK